VRVLRRQAGRRHGTEGKEERLIIHPSEYVEPFDSKFCKSKETSCVIRHGKSFCLSAVYLRGNAQTPVCVALVEIFAYNKPIWFMRCRIPLLFGLIDLSARMGILGQRRYHAAELGEDTA